MRNRNSTFLIRLSQKEMVALNEKVKKSGFSREKFVRKLLSDCKVYEAPPVDFPKLIKEVNRVGSNIEQILRVANAKHIIDVPRLRNELDELDAIEDAMWKAFAPDGR